MKNIKDFLIGKSEEDIKKVMNKLEPIKQLDKMIEYDTKLLSDDELINFLNNLKPNPNTTKNIIETQIHYACRYGSAKAVKYFLDKGAKYDDNNYQKVLLTFRNNQTDIAKVFIEKMKEDGVENKLTIVSNYCLRRACKNGNLILVKELSKNNVPLEYPYNDPFKYACKSGNVELVKFLLQDKKINASSGNNAALYNAFNDKSYDIVKLLLQDEKVIEKLKNDTTLEKMIKNVGLL